MVDVREPSEQEIDDFMAVLDSDTTVLPELGAPASWPLPAADAHTTACAAAWAVQPYASAVEKKLEPVPPKPAAEARAPGKRPFPSSSASKSDSGKSGKSAKAAGGGGKAAGSDTDLKHSRHMEVQRQYRQREKMRKVLMQTSVSRLNNSVDELTERLDGWELLVWKDRQVLEALIKQVNAEDGGEADGGEAAMTDVVGTFLTRVEPAMVDKVFDAGWLFKFERQQIKNHFACMIWQPNDYTAESELDALVAVRRHFSTARWMVLEAMASFFGVSDAQIALPFVRWARGPCLAAGASAYVGLSGLAMDLEDRSGEYHAL